jgi:hypothetical protein
VEKWKSGKSENRKSGRAEERNFLTADCADFADKGREAEVTPIVAYFRTVGPALAAGRGTPTRLRQGFGEASERRPYKNTKPEGDGRDFEFIRVIRG